MKTLLTLVVVLLLGAQAQAALVLRNGTFDDDPDLGSADDPVTAPTGWFQHYPGEGTWSDFRFGSEGRGGWTDNAISLGQNFNPDAGPEDGYYYTNLGQYGGEVSARVNGFGYNRADRANPAGSFVVTLYSTRAGTFTGADGADLAAVGTQLATTTVDISALTGTTPQSQAFNVQALFAGSGVLPGDDIWLHFGDGPDDGNLETLDEPMIDNLTLTVVVPEPAGAAVLLLTAGVSLLRHRRR